MTSIDWMPESLEELADWAYFIHRRTAGQTIFRLLYTPADPADDSPPTLREVGLRLQGFLASFSLSATGDWNL